MARAKKSALITGITGQDGAYLAAFLLEKGYEVHGLKRRSSLPNTTRLTHLLDQIVLHEGDLTDSGSLIAAVNASKPDEIYNLAAMSDVAISFATPEFSANVNGLGTLRLLEAIRLLGLKEKTRFYQASTSELFGSSKPPQNELTRFHPRSPYAVAKLFGYWTTVNYREAWGIWAANGILFNHESPFRGVNFVTKKITRSLARITQGLESLLHLGNLNAMRDWGHAKDAIEMQWRILQEKEPSDYVIASGEAHSVREFVELAAKTVGITVGWRGVGVEEEGYIEQIDERLASSNLKRGRLIVKVDPKLFRPSETDFLLGDTRKAREKLGFTSKVAFQALVEEMVAFDLKEAERELWIKSSGDGLS